MDISGRKGGVNIRLRHHPRSVFIVIHYQRKTDDKKADDKQEEFKIVAQKKARERERESVCVGCRGRVIQTQKGLL